MHEIFVYNLIRSYIAGTSVTTTPINRTVQYPKPRTSYLFCITTSSLSTVFVCVSYFLALLEILPPMLHSIRFAVIVNNSNIQWLTKSNLYFLHPRGLVVGSGYASHTSSFRIQVEQFLLGPGRAVEQAQTLDASWNFWLNVIGIMSAP